MAGGAGAAARNASSVMTVPLLLDEMHPPALAQMLRDKSHDVVAVAASADLAGTDDGTVLDFAAGEGRCLVTENVRDFAVLARQGSHAGVLFVSARRWPRTRVGIVRLAAALHEALERDRIPRRDEVAWLS